MSDDRGRQEQETRQSFGIHHKDTNMTIEQLSEQLKTLHNDLIRSNPPQIMTSREAAQFLSVTDETMFRWRKDGVGPSYSHHAFHRAVERPCGYVLDVCGEQALTGVDSGVESGEGMAEVVVSLQYIHCSLQITGLRCRGIAKRAMR